MKPHALRGLAVAAALALARAAAVGWGGVAASATTAASAPAAGARDPGRAPAPAPGCETTRLVQGEHQLLFRLPHPFLRLGSDSVWTSAGAWRRGADYEIEPTRGELRLLRVPTPGETLYVRACRLLEPPPLVLVRREYRPVAAPGESVAASVTAAPPPRPATARAGTAPGATLQLSGNKTVAVDFGSSQDAALRQSLDLTVSGKLAPEVELAAVITDRNTGLTPAGATREIQSLDRVLLELRAPQGGASLGDITLEMADGEFGRLSRRLQGARGAWSARGLGLQAAASSAQGEFNSLQFFGQDGRQGPYRLTDRAGRAGVSVVALSEAVFVDGVRMTRGETADYSIDYDRGEITFTNRRPVSSASRITVDYQFSLDRYRRNLAASAARWERGGLRLFTQFVTESDDRGRPLGLPLDAADRFALEVAGDSGGAALGPGVGPGPGDYDQVVRDATTSYFAFAGLDSGDVQVSFAFVGAGRGSYVDSTQVAGRRVYRFVGPDAGDYRVGRSLPLPDAHQLWTLGAAWQRGGARLEGEGALSRLDRNTFSSRDDADDQGRAGLVRARWEGEPRFAAGGLAKVGVSALYRAVDAYFQPFTRLEAPFAHESWGLPLGADLDRQERLQVGAFVRPRAGGELRGELARLRLPAGFAGLRRSGEWSMDGRLAARARWERVEGKQPALRFADGGREKRTGEVRWRARWLEPALRADWDERQSPSDTGRAGERYRTVGTELRTPAGLGLVATAGHDRRHDDRLEGGRFVERFASHTLRAGLEAQKGSGFLLSLGWERRDRLPRAEPGRVRADLGYSRLQLASPDRRVQGNVSVEVTSEAQSEKRRVLRFVGSGGGAYDSLGNLVGRGDYDLSIEIGPGFEQVSRGATSARAEWQWGGAQAWRGSRTSLVVESEARRRGDLKADQLAPAPARVREAGDLALASVLWRADQELAPDSPLGGLRLLLERRVSADRSFANFVQVLDQRLGTLRWRARPAEGVTVELESRLKRDEALQQVSGGARLERALEERAGTVTLARTAGGRWRLAALGDLSWTLPEGGLASRVLRVGPEAWLAVGERGRIEASGRRAWLMGPEAPSLLPGSLSAAHSPWEGSLRADYRVPPGTHASASLTGRTREGRPGELQGRVELRVFF